MIIMYKLSLFLLGKSRGETLSKNAKSHYRNYAATLYLWIIRNKDSGIYSL